MMWLPGCSRSGRQCSVCRSTTGVNTTLSPAADQNQGVLGAKLLCMGTSSSTGLVEFPALWYLASLIPAPPLLSLLPPFCMRNAHVGNGRCISTSEDFFHAMDFSEKVDREFEVLGPGRKGRRWEWWTAYTQTPGRSASR